MHSALLPGESLVGAASAADPWVARWLAAQVQESQLSESKDMIPAPKLDAYVFVKLLQDAGHVALDDGCVAACPDLAPDLT